MKKIVFIAIFIASTVAFSQIEYMPDNLSGSIFYEPGSNGAEDKIRASLRDKWKEKYGY